jgi:hypothetical protein
MRYALLPAFLLALAGAPAWASASIECETTDGSNIVIFTNSARAANARPDAAGLTIGERTWSTRDTPPGLTIIHYRETRQVIEMDFVGPGVDRYELRIRINLDDASPGTLTRGGEAHPVSCEFG